MKAKTGELVWFDIPVKDFKKAKAFYGKLFGWKFVAMGDEYWMIKAGKELIGGLRNVHIPVKISDTPIMYFSVPKLAPAVKVAKKLGARLIGERVDIPDGMGCFHLMRDQDKNLIGIWSNS